MRAAMKKISFLKEKVLSGENIEKEEALALADAELQELCIAADEIRKKYCGNGFDICAIINGKSGKCSEDCKYCAQAGCHATDIAEYPLLPAEKITKEAVHNAKQGILRFSIVTSGRRLTQEEIGQLCQSIRKIKENTKIEICVSVGLLGKNDFMKLKEAGVTRVHNNLETSRNYFPKICTTHTYDDKITSIQAAQEAGLSVCSGGIMGIGETMEDRIDMALALRELGVYSVPVNMLNPIPGTALENQKHLTEDEICRIIALYRFILPKAAIRMAGGRGLLPDKGVKCFQSGSNAAISGDMLTTSGITAEKDFQILKQLGYTPKLL